MDRPLHILHLEDDPDYSELVKAMLANEGLRAELVLVSNHADFSAALEQDGFDVILGDYKLPGCNGIQAMQTARHKCPDTPFLLVSGTIGEQAAIESLKSGATDYVLKHWPERLVPAVRRAVQEGQERAHRKRAETELVRRERYYRALTENSLDVLSILNRDGVFQYNSPSLKHVLGYQPKELAGQSAFALVHPDDLSGVMRAFEQALKIPEQRVTQEFRYRRRDGSWLTVEAVCQNRLDDAEIAGVVFNTRDISERKRAEDTLRESEDRYRLLVEGSPDAIGIYQDDKLIFVNSTGAQKLGAKTKEELLGRTSEQIIHPEDLPRALDRLQRRLAGETGIYPVEVRYLRLDGTALSVEVSAAPVMFGGKPAVQFIARDITARQQADAQLRDSEALYHSLVENLPQHVFRKDSAGRFTFANGPFCQSLGRPLAEIMGKTDLDFFPAELAAKYRADDQRVIQTGQALETEEENPQADGKITFVNVIKAPLRDAAGRIVGVQGISWDITERKRAEAQLQLQGAALKAAANAIVITDRAGAVTWINPAFTQLTGYPAEKIIGQNPRRLKSDRHDTSFYKNLWDTILEGRVWQGQMINRHKDGRLYTEESIITPVRDERGEITHFIAVKQDVTERARSEMRLSAFASLGQRLGAAKTSRQAAEIIVDVADQLLGWDACTLSLYEAAENKMRHVLNRDTINSRRVECAPAYDRSPPSPIARRILSQGGELILREPPLKLQADGLPFGDTSRPSASLMYVPIRHGASVIGLLSIQSYTLNAYDRRALETLQALADHCGAAWDRMQAEEKAQTAQQQLRQSQKMEAIGQLAGGVAHDFNNLLAVIRGHADLLLMGAEPFSAEASEGIKQIAAAADRAANLTRQLLTFGRKQAMQTKTLDFNEVIGNLTKMLNRIIGEDIQLQCKYSTRLPFVQADVGMMEQVLVNLVVNARDAMPQGGQLLIATEQISLDEAYVQTHPESRAGKFVCLTVSDGGTGIAPEHLPRIFEPFFTTKEPGRGTGLGLATVYGIVKQHQGWIEVSSQVGFGSAFKIFLAAVEPQVAATTDPPGNADLLGGTETILLVEDDNLVRQMSRRILESFGYRILEASSGREALDFWRDHSSEIKLLLTDMVMPGGITGQSLAEQLREQQPALKIIFTSGHSADVAGQDTKFMRRTRSIFLQKPCPPRELIQTVRRSLDER